MSAIRRAVVACCALLAALALWVIPSAFGHGSVRAAAVDAPPIAPLTGQPMLGIPGSNLEVIGASPGEAPEEAWAQAKTGPIPAAVGDRHLANTEVLLRYTPAAGNWEIVPVDDSHGAPIALDWVASEVTGGGGIVLIGTDGKAETIVTRDPGGPFDEAPPPPAAPAQGAHLLRGESLVPDSQVPTMASIDEGGHVGALIAPGAESRVTPGVLHYVNGTWAREPICASVSAGTCVPPVGKLTADALAASGPGNAWLLASVSTSKPPQLFERIPGPAGTPRWVRQQPSSWLFGSGQRPIGGETISPPPSGATLTAVGQGVWVDFQLAGAGAIGSATVFVSASASAGDVAGTWCFPTTLCPSGTPSLGAPLPQGYGSFAWAGGGPGDPGTRVISGLATAALLRLSDGSSTFGYQITGGDSPGALGGGGTFGPGGETLTTGGRVAGGAAFDSPSDGWLGTGLTPPQETPKVVHLTSSPTPSALASWPVPFRGPLLAVATAAGTTPGGAHSPALAVGVHGEVARYAPGRGWAPEFLYNGAGAVQTPTLRGIAWPEPGRAYAVGDNGAMWLWRAETGLWEPDPAKPLNFHGNLTAIAFSPGDSTLGFAAGKQGVLLSYGKTWSQEPLPGSLAQAHFTSVAFAGDEAIASYRMLNPMNAGQEQGGLLVDDGSGWRVDQSAQALLNTLPAGDTVITKVAGLPDGGAVAAGPGVVLERDTGVGPWRFSPTPLADSETGNIAALAAFRDGSSVRALVSIDDDPESDPSGIENTLWQNIDNPPASAAGQPGLLIGPDPLPSHGFLLRETKTGWADREGNDHPNLFTGGASNFDLPGWPDAVLALLTDSSGSQGWAVGGQTGGDALQLGGQSGAANVVQTAGVTRFGGGVSPPVSTSSPISVPPGQATFAFGGGSGCAQPCSDNAGQQLGPDAWLRGAINRAGQIGGLRAFVYLGQRIGSGAGRLDADTYARELADYSDVLFGGSLPVYAEATAQDVNPSLGGSPDFAGALGAHVPAATTPPGSPAPPAGTAAYAFDSQGNGGSVRVVVLDYSSGSLSGSGGAQLTWLAGELDSAKAAKLPAIVVGGGDITDAGAPNAATDGGAVAQVLLTHGASAYMFYDAAAQNVAEAIGSGTNRIPVFGTGTLGYVRPPGNAPEAQAFLGAGGFLLVSVDAARRDGATNRAPVSAKLIPDAGELALEATDGTLLRRSQVALFQGLARRPLGGAEWIGGSPGSEAQAPDPYTLLPQTCLGSNCAKFIRPVYSFSSSNPKIGDFVEHDPNSPNPRQILQSAAGKPVPDPTSGLFCAYNPGTTTITIASGGLSYSEPVTVQSGSVEEPCGTVPFTDINRNQGPGNPNTPPPPPVGPGPTPSPTPPVPVPVPPPPGPIVPVATPPALTPSPAPPPSVTLPPLHPAVTFPFAAIAATPPKILLPAANLIARPIPPSGFAGVTVVAPIAVRVVEEERKEEEAVESARNAFAIYRPEDHNLILPATGVVLLVLAAGIGGAGLRRRRPRGAAAYARTEVRRERWR